MIIDVDPRTLWGNVVFTARQSGLVAIEAIAAALATRDTDGMRTASEIAKNNRFRCGLRLEPFHTTSYDGGWPDDDPSKLCGRFVEVVLNGEDRLLSMHQIHPMDPIHNRLMPED